MINNYCIRYTDKNGHYTSHSFDSLKELKKILSEQCQGIIVEWKMECNTRQIREICANHNMDIINKSGLPL